MAVLGKWLARVARDGELRACYACEVIAPSLIPKLAGVHRKPHTAAIIRERAARRASTLGVELIRYSLEHVRGGLHVNGTDRL